MAKSVWHPCVVQIGFQRGDGDAIAKVSMVIRLNNGETVDLDTVNVMDGTVMELSNLKVLCDEHS